MRKKLLTILLSLFVMMTAFTTRVFATSYNTIEDILNIATNIPEMSGDSIPEGAWTNGNGGYLVKVGDAIYFTDADDTYPHSISTINTVTDNGDGTYGYTDYFIVVEFTVTNDSLVSVTVSNLTDSFLALNGEYSAPVTIADILPVDIPGSAEGGWSDYYGNKMYIYNEMLYVKIDDSSTSLIGLNTNLNRLSDICYECEFNDGDYLYFYLDNNTLKNIAYSLKSNPNNPYNFYTNYLFVDGILYRIISLDDMTVEVYNGNSYTQSSITIPETVEYNSKTYTVTSVGYATFAFHNCIEDITIPGTITSIDQSAFYGEVLSNVTVKATTPPELGSSVFNSSNNNLKILVPLSSYEDYTNEDPSVSKGWYAYKDKIDAYVTIADLLIDFPASSNEGWVNENGYKIYLASENSLYYPDCFSPLDISATLTKSGNNYTYDVGFYTLKFVIEDNELKNIQIVDAQNLYEKFEGTYEPYEFQNPTISVQVGSTEDIEFVTNATYIDSAEANVSVKIDNISLDRANYTVARGSTKVTLKGSYVSTLAVGTHTITISVNGYSDINQEFTITAAPSPTPGSTPRYTIPNTGVEYTPTNNHSLLKLSSLSILAIGTYMVIKKKKDN